MFEYESSIIDRVNTTGVTSQTKRNVNIGQQFRFINCIRMDRRKSAQSHGN